MIPSTFLVDPTYSQQSIDESESLRNFENLREKEIKKLEEKIKMLDERASKSGLNGVEEVKSNFMRYVEALKEKTITASHAGQYAVFNNGKMCPDFFESMDVILEEPKLKSVKCDVFRIPG